MINALKVLRTSGPTHLRLVSDILLAGAGDFVRTVNLVVVEMDNGFAGLYDAQSNTVILNLNEHNGRGLGDVLVHELLHAATVNVFTNPRTAAQRAAAARIGQLRQLALNLAQRQGITSPAILHGLQSDAEFLAYALTAPEFQSLLKGLALPEQRNIFQRLVDAVLNLFGLDPAKFRTQRDAVSELIDFAKMGMAHRRTFTTDMRWDQHEADRVNAQAERLNYHASRIEAGKSGVYGARSGQPRFEYQIEEQPAGNDTQFTIYFDNKVEDVRVVDAAMVESVRAALNEQYFGEATAEDVAALTRSQSDNDIRFAQPASGTGDIAIDPQAELESMLPEGMTTIQNAEMLGMMGTRRSQPWVIQVNPTHLANSIRGLSPESARRMIRTTLDEELAELAADKVMTEQGYTELATSLSPEERYALEHSYYGTMGGTHAEMAARIEADRKSGAWTDADLGREWFRQQTTRLAFGRTREETIERILELGDSNPSLFTRIVEALQQYLRELKSFLAVTFTSGTAARIGLVSRELRRIRNEGVLPDPEKAPAGEMGDTTAFLNALDDNLLPGQEDRLRFAFPVYGDKGKVDKFWTSVQSRFYDMGHPVLKAVMDIRDGTNKAVEYDMEIFHKRFPRMQQAALSAGVTNEELMLVFGTTAPMVQESARKVIAKQLRAEGLGWKRAQHDKDVHQKREVRERELYDAAAFRMADNFRKNQQAMEESLRGQGFGEMVDFMVEFRNRLNKHKVAIGFGESNDVYLTRTYRYFKTPAWAAAVKSGAVFTDPETGEVVDFGALRQIAATEMFEEGVRKAAKKEGRSLSKDEVAQQAMVELDTYLGTLDARAATNNTMDGVLMLRKDLNLLKAKKDIDFPLRHLLGEVKDPFEVMVRTLHNVSRFAANEVFLKDFTAKALELKLASYTPTEGMEMLFPARQSDRYDALAGLYVKTDIAQALRDEFISRGPSLETAGQRVVNKVTRAAAWYSGAAVFAKTSLGIGYWPRNLVSNFLLTTAQGLNPFSFSSLGKTTNVARLANIDFLENSTEIQRDHIRRLTELQIVRDDAQGRMTMDLLRGFAAGTQEQVDERLKLITQAQATGDLSKLDKLWQGSKVPGGMKWLVEATANLNNFVDSMAKINAYYQELAQIRQNFGDTMSETEAEAYAARKVKLTFPTHSQQLSAVKAFNRSPLGLALIPFLRWKTEVLRTMINTVPLAMEEINSGNPGEVRRGVKRLLGFSLTVGGGASELMSFIYMGISSSIGALAGEDDEEKESRPLTAEERADIRLGLPKWKREHDFVARLVGGRIQMVDLTYILPHSMVSDVYAIIKEGATTDRAGMIRSLARYIGGEVIGTNIAYTGAVETFTNKDDFGRQITLDTDTPLESFGKLAWHMMSSTVMPSSVQKVLAVTRYGETKGVELMLGEVSGGRAMFFDRNEIAKKMLRTLKSSQDAAVALRWPIESGRALPLEDIEPVLDKHQAALNKNQLRLHQALSTMRSIGISDPQVYRIADGIGISKPTITDGFNATRRAWIPNPAWDQKVYKNQVEAKEEADPSARLRKVRQIISSRPGFYRVQPEDEE